MSNNTSTSWCNNCYHNSHNHDCGCVNSSVYPSVYYPNSLDYAYPDEMRYGDYEEYGSLKYQQAIYPSSYEDACYYADVNQTPYYPVLPLPREYNPSLAPSYWSKQHQPQQLQASVTSGAISSNYPPHCISSSSSNTNSDPLNALQNLTVSAGQPVQVMAQQSINNRINSAMYNSAIRPRSLGSVQRPVEKYTVIPQATSQSLVPVQVTQTQQSSFSASLSSNTTMSRLSNKNVVIKGELGHSHSPSLSSAMSTPHSLDSSGTPASGQQLLSQNSQKSSAIHLFQNSPGSQAVHTAQPPSIISPSSTLVNQPKPATSSNTSVVRPTMNISEEEIKKVSEEIKRLKEKYLKTLRAIIDNQKKYPEDEMKVFKVLRTILEHPDSISKPLSMKHVTKIEQYLVKAEQWLHNDNHSSLAHISSSSQAPNIAKALSSSRKSVVSVDNPLKQAMKCKSESVNETIESRAINSLDIAFNEVCHQLISTDPKILKKVQRGLVEYVESKGLRHSYFLPKRLIFEDNEDDDNKNTFKRRRMISGNDDDELNYSSNTALGNGDCDSGKDVVDILKKLPNHFTILNFDNQKMKDYTLEEELHILQKEFEVEEIMNEDMSKQWSTFDAEWNESVFYSISFKTETSLEIVPPLKVRIPDDYLYGRYVDWNLNEESYSPECSHFLRFVIDNLLEEFSKINQFEQWSGLTLLQVTEVYKKSILSTKSNYQNLKCQRQE